jgi:cytochrome b subunit of formate dehydrogenase
MAQEPEPTLWQVIMSVLAALFGVQSSQGRARDFIGGKKWWIYLLVGVFAVLLLVTGLIIVAKIILWQATVG